MIERLKQLFGIGPKIDTAALIANGAVIVDVRTKQEYAAGHVKNSLNIPLDTLLKRMKELPSNKPIITCCASGMRSGTARSILLNNGFKEVYNAGSWRNIN
jgi:phage shock protein E